MPCAHALHMYLPSRLATEHASGACIAMACLRGCRAALDCDGRVCPAVAMAIHCASGLTPWASCERDLANARWTLRVWGTPSQAPISHRASPSLHGIMHSAGSSIRRPSDPRDLLLEGPVRPTTP